MSTISRRGLLKGLVVGAAVLGFDPSSRSWVTEAAAQTAAPFAGLPPLDGTLTTDANACAARADDYGHLVHRTPIAVLLPGSVNDIVALVQFAREHDIKVVMRGRGHTTFGQAQADAGVVIDMSALAQIHSISATGGFADVDAGVVWRDLLLATTAVGLAPPVVTAFTGLTVGGTLSVGGCSGTSYRYGAQVDNVLEVQVVTGEGALITCSPTQNLDLFNAVLAGLGLCGIIVRAKVKLITAKPLARTHRCFYASIPTLLHDMRLLAQEERFDDLRANCQPSPTGWVCFIEGTSFYSPIDENDLPPQDPFAGLSCIPGISQIEEQSYFGFCDAIYQLIQFLELLGLSGLPHPWLDLFVPDAAMDAFASGTMANLNLAEFLPGSAIIMFPFVKAKLNRPLFRVPEGDTFFLFDILQTAPPVPAVIGATLARNRALYDQNVAQGGTFYTISAVQLSSEDWKSHFQPYWGTLRSAKSQHDPDNVLGTGVPVFEG